MVVFKCIEVFCTRQRIHGSLGYISPNSSRRLDTDIFTLRPDHPSGGSNAIATWLP